VIERRGAGLAEPLEAVQRFALVRRNTREAAAGPAAAGHVGQVTGEPRGTEAIRPARAGAEEAA
jgi:hypothetical protein